jgi:hypothetical protein
MTDNIKPLGRPLTIDDLTINVLREFTEQLVAKNRAEKQSRQDDEIPTSPLHIRLPEIKP